MYECMNVDIKAYINRTYTHPPSHTHAPSPPSPPPHPTHRSNLLEEVHRECAYEAEKAEKLRRKITNILMTGTIVQEIPLYGFNMPSNGRKSAGVRVVKSLRTQVNLKSKKPLLIAPLFLPLL